MKIDRFNQTALYVIKQVIPDAHFNIYGSYNLVPLAPFMLEVCLGIMLVVTPNVSRHEQITSDLITPYQ